MRRVVNTGTLSATSGRAHLRTVQSRGITKIDEVIRTRGVITEEQTYKANTLQVLGLLNVKVESKIYRGGNNMKFENNSQENRELKISKVSKTFLELREIVNRFDPVNLVEGGAPDDEHDRLTTEILMLLSQESMDEIRDLLINCEIWYGYDPNDIKEEYRERFNSKIDRTHKEILNWHTKNKNQEN